MAVNVVISDEDRARRLIASAGALLRRDELGRTPLHIAAQNGRAEVCRIYLDAGADAKKKDVADRTPADLARLSGHHQIAGMLDRHVDQTKIPKAKTAVDIVKTPQPLSVPELMFFLREPEKSTEDLIRNGRLAAIDAKGDTILHIAARKGNMLACNRLVQAGADPNSRNHDKQRPCEVAFLSGHKMLAELLQTLVSREKGEQPSLPPRSPQSSGVVGYAADAPSKPVEFNIDLPDDFTFDMSSEESPEEFFVRGGFKEASAIFEPVDHVVHIINDAKETVALPEFSFDLATIRVEGDGIGVVRPRSAVDDQAEEAGFLQPRRGRGRAMNAVRVAPSSRISVDSVECADWVSQLLSFGYCTTDMIDELVSRCIGNFDPNELRLNLARLVESADINLIENEPEADFWQVDSIWDSVSNVLDVDLVEAVFALCNRWPDLPGAGPFNLSRRRETELFDGIAKARDQTLRMIASNQTGLEAVVAFANDVLAGEVPPDLMTDLNVNFAHPDEETEQFATSVAILLDLVGEMESGFVDQIDGVLREIIQALQELRLKQSFIEDLGCALLDDPEASDCAKVLLSKATEAAKLNAQLVDAHLPLARRLALREVGEADDPEDLFQQAFMGLNRAVATFEPALGHRFMTYAAAWMKQRIKRYRLDLGDIVRIPVHAHEKLADLDAAFETLNDRLARMPTPEEISTELGGKAYQICEMRRFLRIPTEFDEFSPDLPFSDAETVDERIWRADLARIVNRNLALLPERRAEVVRKRFGFDLPQEMTLEEVGTQFGVTRERIRQIEAGALETLVHPTRLGALRRYF